VQNWNRSSESSTKPIPKVIADLSWMEDSAVLGKDLSAELVKTRYAVRGKRNRYLENTTSNVTFHESQNPIKELSWEYRLLVLFRYWNIIEYFFPAKYMTDHNWNDVLTAHIPKFIEVESGLEWSKTVARLISEINDTHACSEWIPAFGDYGTDVMMSFIENKLVATNATGGIKPGDEILTIDGKHPSEIKAKVAEYFSISNEGGLLRQTAVYARRTNNQTITITYISDGNTKTENFPTRLFRNGGPTQMETPSTRAFNTAFQLVEDGTIGYINAGYYVATEASVMMNQFRNTKGIIIDMRIYPNSSMFSLTYGYFTNVIQNFSQLGQTDAHTPGIVYLFGRSNAYTSNYSTYSGKVVVIVNENTQSNGEYVTMQLQTIPGCVTIGSQTAGADGNISRFYITNGLQTVISGLGVNYPDGTETQRVGIRIDEIVKPTIAGIKAGKDELYERAVELIYQ